MANTAAAKTAKPARNSFRETGKPSPGYLAIGEVEPSSLTAAIDVFGPHRLLPWSQAKWVSGAAVVSKR